MTALRRRADSLLDDDSALPSMARVLAGPTDNGCASYQIAVPHLPPMWQRPSASRRTAHPRPRPWPTAMPSTSATSTPCQQTKTPTLTKPNPKDDAHSLIDNGLVDRDPDA